MWDKLEAVAARIPALERLLSDPAVTGNAREMQRIGRELTELRPVAEAHARYRRIERELAENRAMLESENDPEMRGMAREEISRLSEEMGSLEKEVRLLLIPRDPNDDKNILIEIRAGAGGEEASLFATGMFRALSRFSTLLTATPYEARRSCEKASRISSSSRPSRATLVTIGIVCSVRRIRSVY